MKILCIDDEEGIQSSIATRIKYTKVIKWDYRAAYSIVEGLKIADEFKPNIILLDLHYKAQGGGLEEAIAAIKPLNVFGGVVILTGFSTPDRWEQCMKNGAMFFLDKNEVLISKECAVCGSPENIEHGSKFLFSVCLNVAMKWKADHE